MTEAPLILPLKDAEAVLSLVTPGRSRFWLYVPATVPPVTVHAKKDRSAPDHASIPVHK